MARRVNTHFVIGLCTALAVAAGGVAGIVVYHRWRNHDPVWLTSRGEAAEKAGDIRSAATDYLFAAQASQQKHQADADSRYVRAGKACMAEAKSAQNEEDAIRFYQLGLGAFDAALQENPRDKEANEIGMDEQYSAVMLQEEYPNIEIPMAAGGWVRLKKLSETLIQNHDSAKARACHAEALLRLLPQKLPETLSAEAFDKEFADIDSDLKKAVELDPASGKAAALQAETILYKATLVLMRSGKNDLRPYQNTILHITDERADPTSVRLVEDFVKQEDAARSLLLDFLAKHGINSDVAQEVADLALLRASRLTAGPRNENSQKLADAASKEMATASDMLEKALSTDPGSLHIADSLSRAYERMDNSDKRAEEVLKKTVSLNPDGPAAYSMLAQLYERWGHTAFAVAQYKEAVNHHHIGSGPSSVLNPKLEMNAIESIAWLDMDLAKAASSDPQEGAAKAREYLKDAGDFTDRMRLAHAETGHIDLLDGRAQLLNLKIPEAMRILNRADANLSSTEPHGFRLRRAKLLLVECNERSIPPQIGPMITLLQQVLGKPENNIRDPESAMKLAKLLIQTGQFGDALKQMQALMGSPVYDPKTGEFTGEFTNESMLATRFRDAALGVWADAAQETARNARATDIDAVNSGKMATRIFSRLSQGANTPEATYQVAFALWNAGDYAGAAAQAIRVLDHEATLMAKQPRLVSSSYGIAIESYLTVGKKDEAIKLVDRAVAAFPQDPALNRLKKALNSPDGKVPQEAEVDIVNTMITDEYLKQLRLALIYQPKPQDFGSGMDNLLKTDKSIEALKAAEKVVSKPETPEDQLKLGVAISQIFSVAKSAAGEATSDALRAQRSAELGEADGDAKAASKALADQKSFGDKAQSYLNICQEYAQSAEKWNVDGVNGKLYQGQLNLLRAQIAQASISTTTAARSPDYPAQAKKVAADMGNAVQMIEQAVKERPDYAIGHFALAEAYESEGHRDDALMEFRQVISLEPNNIGAISHAISILLRGNDVASIDPSAKAEAQKYIDTGMRLQPSNPFFQSSNDLLLSSDDEVDAAINRREAAYTRDPSDWYNAMWLARLYETKRTKLSLEEKLKQPNKGAEILKKLLAGYPENLDIAKAFAVVLAGDNDIDGALKVFDPFVASADGLVRWEAMKDKATLQKQAHRVQDAIDTLRQAIKIEPPGADMAQRMLGDLLFDEKRWAEAESVYQDIADAIKNDPVNRNRVLRRVIDARIRQGKFADAMKQIDAMIQGQSSASADVAGKSELAQTLVLRAFCDVQQKNSQQALTDLNRAIALDESNSAALTSRAQLELEAGNTDAAIKDLVSARTLSQGVECRRLLAQIYSRTRRYNEAEVVYNEILKLQPDLVEVRLEYVEFLYNLAEQQQKLAPESSDEFARAIRVMDPQSKLLAVLQDSARRYPGDFRWPLMFARLLILRNNNDRALDFCKSLYEAQPQDAQIRQVYVEVLLKTKNFDKAIDVASETIKAGQDFIAQNPRYVVFYLQRAKAYIATSKQDLAVQDVDQAFTTAAKAVATAKNFGPLVTVLNQATTILPADLVEQRLRARLAASPDETATQIALIQVLIQSGKMDDAMKITDTVKVPSDPQLKAMTLRETALARFQSKHYGDADTDYRALLKIAPDDVDTLNNYAYMLADGMKKPKEAIEVAQKALEVLTNRADVNSVAANLANVYDTLGWAHCLNGDLQDAIDALHHSINTKPMAAGYLHLADAYVKSKQLTEARQAIDDGLKLASADNDQDSLDELKKLKASLSQQ